MRQRCLGARANQSGPFASLWATLDLKNFQLFHFHTGGQFLLPQRANNGKREILPTQEMDETGGFGCQGHSIWTICIPLSPFCPEIFPTFPSSYWGANSYYPRGLIMGKREIFQLQNWMTQRVLSAWGIHTGPFASHSIPFVMKIFHLFRLHTGSPFLRGVF